MSDRPEFPELMPPEVPHVQRVLSPGWWILPAFALGAVLIAIIGLAIL